MLLVTFLLSMLGINALSGFPLSVGNLATLFPILGIQFLLHVAFAAFAMVVAEMTRSLLISNLICIFTAFGFIGMLVGWIVPKVSSYMILSRVQMTMLPLDTALIPTSIVISMVALAGYLILSSFIFQKRDTY